MAAVIAGATAGGAPAIATAAPPPVQPARTVILPTGEKVALTWVNGHVRVGRLAGQPASALTVVTVGADVYAIPAEAVGHLATGLDRELFDVTRLAALPADRIPVTVPQGGQAVPGVTITSRNGTVTKGYLDAAGARVFGDTLGKNASPVRMALDAPTAGTVQPNYAMVTLTVRYTPPAGVTSLGTLAMITNTDDNRKYTNFVGIGSENYIKVSLPKGHYTIIVNTIAKSVDGKATDSYFATSTDNAVTGDGQTVALDGGRATATPPSFTTPRPSSVLDAGADLIPARATDGIANGFGVLDGPNDHVFVQPTSAPRHGILEFDAYERRSATEPDGTPATYHLTADWSAGIPADLHRTVQPNQLARVSDRIFGGDASGQRAFGRGPVYPDLRGETSSDSDTVPNTPSLVDYLYGPPNVRWDAAAYQGAASGAEGMETVPQAYQPGRSYPVDWMHGLATAGFFGGKPFPRPYCVACRTADKLALSTFVMDSNPDHSGWVGGANPGFERLQVFQDGTSIVDTTDKDDLTVPLPADSHTYRIEDTVDRAAMGFSTSTKISSVYTFSSSATSGAAVPTGWNCAASATEACTILPLLTMNVPLPVSQAGTLPAGTSTFVVTAGHVTAAATKSAITGLTFATSVDGGAYVPATVTGLGNGRYRVTLRSAATGHPVSVRVTAQDAAGGSLSTTTENAYTVTGS
ncbi:hypothetical protein [Fodinicola feengrottensis]|uniref:hypothetical protein n=1 Tax=Fodinicola feengrottensis TaxID=435914 RepID=UPI00244132C8|nr:hypothetical protein [Fodinicola feengrottensis]